MISFLVALSLSAADEAPADPKRFKSDLKLLCGIEARATSKDPSKRAEQIANALAAIEFGDDYTAFFSRLSGEYPDEKPAVLLSAARRAGLSSCAFAESSQRESVVALKRACAKREPDSCERLKTVTELWKAAGKVAVGR